MGTMRRLIQAVLLPMLVPVLTCCTSSRNSPNPEIHIPVPDPYIEGKSVVVYGEASGDWDSLTVDVPEEWRNESLKPEGPVMVVPSWYWRRLTGYVLDTQAESGITP